MKTETVLENSGVPSLLTAKKLYTQWKLMISAMAIVAILTWFRLSYSESLTVSPLKCRLSRVDGAVQEVVIALRNNSWRSTILHRIKTSCGCTARVNLTEETTLPSGKTYELIVKVDVPPYGKKSSTLTVEDAFGKTHLVEFQMQGLKRQLPFVQSELRRLELNSDEYRKTVQSSFLFCTVESSGSPTPWIASIRPSATVLVCDVVDVGSKPTLDGIVRTYEVKVQMQLTERSEQQNQISLELVDQHGDRTGISVATARCLFKHDLRILPTNIVLSAPRSPRASFVVRSARGILPDGIEIVPSVDWLELKVLRRSAGQMIVEVFDKNVATDGVLLTGNIAVRSKNSILPSQLIEIVHK